MIVSMYQMFLNRTRNAEVHRFVKSFRLLLYFPLVFTVRYGL
jgi:hypothetical protein